MGKKEEETDCVGSFWGFCLGFFVMFLFSLMFFGLVNGPTMSFKTYCKQSGGVYFERNNICKFRGKIFKYESDLEAEIYGLIIKE